jgi:hypothetical protein
VRRERERERKRKRGREFLFFSFFFVQTFSSFLFSFSLLRTHAHLSQNLFFPHFHSPSLLPTGVLKATSFLFEYVGRAGGDYVDAITPLLADALADRDAIHRQTAAAALGHVALGVAGLGREDALVHLLNLLWPNVFEAAPHVARAVSFAVEALRLALGPGVMLEYLLQGLFHPARRVRETYWRHYNSLYVGSAAALVAFYPQLDAIGPQEEGGKKKKNEDDDDDDEEEEGDDDGLEGGDGPIDAKVFSAPSYRRHVMDVFI